MSYMDETIRKAAELIRQSQRVVVFTGAGVSTESGIPDFRSPGGIWQKYDPQEFYFQRFMSSEESREKYWRMSLEFYEPFKAARPNAAHKAVAELEKAAQLQPAEAGKFYYNLGAVMMNTGQLDAAGEAFKKAISLSPNYAPAQFQYGLYLLGKASIGADGKIQPPAGTVEVFQTYLTLEPNGPNAEQAKGILASLDQAIQTNYSNPDARKKPAQKKK